MFIDYFMQDSDYQMNAYETETSYQIEYQVPGLTKDDIKVKSVSDRVIEVTISPKKSEEKRKWVIREFISRSEESRQEVKLPDDIDQDKIGAKVENGILSITIPKKDRPEYKTIVVE